MNQIHICQVNANRSFYATNSVLQFALEKSIDVLLLQDPYVDFQNRVPGLSSFQIYGSDSRKVATVILNPSLTSSFFRRSLNTIGIVLVLEKESICVINTYFPPHDLIEGQVREVEGFLKVSGNYLIAGDFSARSQIWGYQIEDSRGREVLGMIATKGLTLINDKRECPSFSSGGRVGNPDLTLATGKCVELVTNWRINREEVLSDHFMILYDLGQYGSGTEVFYKTKYGIGKFLYLIRPKLLVFEEKLVEINNRRDLNSVFSEMVDIIWESMAGGLRKRKCGRKRKLSWWNTDLLLTRRKLTAL